MTKITLGKPPKSFERTVKFVQVDGQPGKIRITYTYRDREAFGKFTDGVISDIRAADEAEMDKLKELATSGGKIPELTESMLLARQDETNIRYIMGCVEGWDLDVAFDKSAVAQLVREVPAAIPAIVAAYRDAITEGRQGN